MVQLRETTRFIDNEQVVTIEFLLSKEGKELVLELCEGEGVVAVRACAHGPGKYLVETINWPQYERMRSTKLLAAYFSSVEKHRSEAVFPRDFASYLANHEELLILDTGSAFRVYHY